MLEVKHRGRTGQTALLNEFGEAAWGVLAILTKEPAYPFTARIHYARGLNRTFAYQITVPRDTI